MSMTNHDQYNQYYMSMTTHDQYNQYYISMTTHDQHNQYYCLWLPMTSIISPTVYDYPWPV